MRINGTKAFAALFGVLGLASVVCALCALVHTHNVNASFDGELRITRGLGEGWIDTLPGLGPKREAELRRLADELEQNRDSFTLPYWIPIVALAVSLGVCGSAAALWRTT